SIPLPAGFDQGAANPIAKFDDHGHLFVSFMAATFVGQRPPVTSPDFFNAERNSSDRRFGFQSDNGIFVSRSDDGGRSWASPVPVELNDFAGNDIPFDLLPDLAIDTFARLPNGATNPNYGAMYVTWMRVYPAGQMPGAPNNPGGDDIMIAVS